MVCRTRGQYPQAPLFERINMSIAILICLALFVLSLLALVTIMVMAGKSGERGFVVMYYGIIPYCIMAWSSVIGAILLIVHFFRTL